MTNKSVILFDGVCNLCNRSVQFVIKHDPEGKFMFTSLQSESGQKLLKEYKLPANEFNSFILLENGRAYTRSTGALKVTRRLKSGWKLLYGFIIVPHFIRDPVYNWIARNRYRWFGKTETCMIPSPELTNRFLI